MSQEAECRATEPVQPRLRKDYIKSQVACVRAVEMLCALVAFICVQMSVTCKWQFVSEQSNTFIQNCGAFNEHSFRFFSAMAMISILVNLTLYCIHIFNLMDMFDKAPWGLVILIQTGASCASILLASAILAGNTYGSHAAMAGVALGFLTALIYGFHFIWEIMANRNSNQGSSDYAREGHDHALSNSDDDIDLTDADIPTLSSVTLRRHSIEFVPREATDTKTYYVEEKSTHTCTNDMSTTTNSLSSSSSSFASEGRLELCNYRPSCNSSGSEEKSSWVITGNGDGMSKEDNSSTGNYTVEVGNA